MALTPKFSTSSSSYSYGSRRKKNGFGKFLMLAILLLLIGVGVWFFFIKDDSGNIDANADGEGGAEVIATEQVDPNVIASGNTVLTNTSTGDVRLPEAIDSPIAAVDTDGNGPSGLTDDSPFGNNNSATLVEETGTVAALLRQGMAHFEAEEYQEARVALSAALLDPRFGLKYENAILVRQTLSTINDRLLEGGRIHEDEDILGVLQPYTIVSGDVLSVIARRYGVNVGVIQKINYISNPRAIRAGQHLRVINGPIHVRVSKRDMRLDLYAANSKSQIIFLWSFPVGLGAEDSTPNGLYDVGIMVSNPGWTDPRAHVTYDRDDPEIPIGEYWIDLSPADGAPDQNIGIHGTNEPESIGRMMSMGCVRMADQPIEFVYGCLRAERSQVRIEP